MIAEMKPATRYVFRSDSERDMRSLRRGTMEFSEVFTKPFLMKGALGPFGKEDGIAVGWSSALCRGLETFDRVSVLDRNGRLFVTGEHRGVPIDFEIKKLSRQGEAFLPYIRPWDTVAVPDEGIDIGGKHLGPDDLGEMKEALWGSFDFTHLPHFLYNMRFAPMYSYELDNGKCVSIECHTECAWTVTGLGSYVRYFDLLQDAEEFIRESVCTKASPSINAALASEAAKAGSKSDVSEAEIRHAI